MRVLIVILQILISLFITASAMPALLATVPAARNDRIGLVLMASLFTVSFAVLTLVWPKSSKIKTRK
jgi:hypothetical protein